MTAALVPLVYERKHAAIEVVEQERVGQAECNRTTRTPGDVRHHFGLDLARRVCVACPFAQAGGGLEHSPAVVPHDLSNCRQFVAIRPRSRNRATIGHAMEEGPGRREADGLVDQRAHRFDVGFPCRFLAETALTHCMYAHRTMADHAPHVHALRPALDRVEVLPV